MKIALSLAASLRNPHEKSTKDVRTEGFVPGTVYGLNKEPLSVQIAANELLKAYREVQTSGIIALDIEGTKETVLIHDFQVNPVHNTLQHVDFLRVEAGKKTFVRIPFEFIGESNAVKTFGAVFLIGQWNLPVKCLPEDILRKITINKKVLKTKGDKVKIKDLKLDPKKYQVVRFQPDVLVCSVSGKTKSKEDLVLEEIEEETPEEATVTA